MMYIYIAYLPCFMVFYELSLICWFSSCWKRWWTILESIFTSKWLILELFLFLWKLWRKRWVFSTKTCYLAWFVFIKLNLCFIFSLLQSDLPVRERIFLLLDATQTSLGGASGKFPQYYNAYYNLVVGTTMWDKLLGCYYNLICIHLICS